MLEKFNNSRNDFTPLWYKRKEINKNIKIKNIVAMLILIIDIGMYAYYSMGGNKRENPINNKVEAETKIEKISKTDQDAYNAYEYLMKNKDKEVVISEIDCENNQISIVILTDEKVQCLTYISSIEKNKKLELTEVSTIYKLNDKYSMKMKLLYKG